MIVRAAGMVSEVVWRGARGCQQADALFSPLATLVLTGHDGLRDRLRSIVVGRGGRCRAPSSLAAAWRAVGAECGLAFIDIARPLDGSVSEARALAETLALRQGVLLAVCGRPADSGNMPGGGDDEECWARQMGAFVYLPGVGSDAGITLLVDEARRIFRGRGR
jgi:hypothetical protein